MFESALATNPNESAVEAARATALVPALALGFALFYEATLPLVFGLFGSVPRPLFEAVRVVLLFGALGGGLTFARHVRTRERALRTTARELLWLVATVAIAAFCARALFAMSIPML